MIPYRVHIDTAYFIVIQRIMSNFADIKNVLLTQNRNRNTPLLLHQKPITMKSIFRTSFYLRSNYLNKEGKASVMMRIHLNGERVALGTTGVSVDPEMWDNTLGKVRGRTKETLATNAQLTSISTDLQVIFQRLEFSEELSLERIKSEYLGKREAMETVLSLFTKYNNDMYAQIGCGVSKANYRKFNICKRHFTHFLEIKYARTDLNAIELTPIVIHDFDVYLRTIVGQSFNTAIKTLKTFKTVIIFGRKAGVFNHDPFLNIHFKTKRVDRGFLTDEEIDTIMHKEFATQRLINVRDIFLFSCFTGLAYVDVANLTDENIITMDGKQWIVTARKKTDTLSHILLLDIPKMIIEKYAGCAKNGRLIPILSNQRMNSYLKEIADVCGINKNLTFHMARHTFATMMLTKGVPVESVSKMLGHSSITTTQLYARITNKKIENDMLMVSKKLDKFNFINSPATKVTKQYYTKKNSTI